MRKYELLVAAARGVSGIKDIKSRDFEDNIVPVLGQLLQTVVVMVLAVLVAGTVAFVGFDVVAIWALVTHWAGMAVWKQVLAVLGLVLANGSVLGLGLWLRCRGM
jgi:hypothetical protein